jgi:hypothetical protein
MTTATTTTPTTAALRTVPKFNMPAAGVDGGVTTAESSSNPDAAADWGAALTKGRPPSAFGSLPGLAA